MTIHLAVFSLAFLASAAPPGPDTLTVFSRGLRSGLIGAIPFSIGVALAKVSLLTLALLGIAEIAQRFETGFLFVKYGGAAYLCFLGIQQIVRRGVVDDNPDVDERGRWQDLLVGFGLGVSNPNAVIFYVALLPSVVDVGNVGVGLYAILVALVVVLWLTVAATYGGLAGRLRATMRSTAARRRVRHVSGATMLGAGVLVATR